jgi:hypothetical protein
MAEAVINVDNSDFTQHSQLPAEIRSQLQLVGEQYCGGHNDSTCSVSNQHTHKTYHSQVQCYVVVLLSAAAAHRSAVIDLYPEVRGREGVKAKEQAVVATEHLSNSVNQGAQSNAPRVLMVLLVHGKTASRARAEA